MPLYILLFSVLPIISVAYLSLCHLARQLRYLGCFFFLSLGLSLFSPVSFSLFVMFSSLYPTGKKLNETAVSDL